MERWRTQIPEPLCSPTPALGPLLGLNDAPWSSFSNPYNWGGEALRGPRGLPWLRPRLL